MTLLFLLVASTSLALCADSFIDGVVLGPDGTPIPNAVVAASRSENTVFSSQLAVLVRSDRDGRFRLTVAPGTFGITATAPRFAGAFLPNVTAMSDGAGPKVKLTLRTDGITLSGIVRTQKGRAVAGATVMAARYSTDRGDIFHTIADEHGRWQMMVSDGKYGFGAVLNGVSSPGAALKAADAGSVQLWIKDPPRGWGPPAQAASDWARKHAIRLTTTSAGSGLRDLQPLKKVIGNSRVVAIGEGTHGTREFRQLHHRLFEFLASEMGFTVFAVEVSWQEALFVNHYVLEGIGDPRKAVAGLRSFPFMTEELLDTVHWMRRYNQDAAHRRKLKFFGFDMQYPSDAAANVIGYVAKVDPAFLSSVTAALSPLDSFAKMRAYRKLPTEAHQKAPADIAMVLRRLKNQRATYIARSSEEDWRVAVGNAQTLGQAEQVLKAINKQFNPESSPFGIRDRAMAENVLWMLDSELPGTKMVVVAHNGHVKKEIYGDAVESMGMHLRRSLGRDLFAIGCTFKKGSFLSRGRGGFANFQAGPPREDMIESVLAQTRIPLFALDLRGVPKTGLVAEWFDSQHFTWSGESVGPSKMEDMLGHIIPREAFDALIFVDESTPSRLLSGGPPR